MGGDLTEIWSERAQPREEDAREELNRRSRLETRRQQAEQDKETDTALLFAAVEIARAALQRRIKLLGERLDALDRASLEALEESRRRLEDIRTNANRANDGRRVYEAADGTIYDEEGNEVGRDEIDPDAWNPERPGWEQFANALTTEEKAQELREGVLREREQLNNSSTQKDLDRNEDGIEKLEEEFSAFLDENPELNVNWSSAAASNPQTARTGTSASRSLAGDWNSERSVSPDFRAAAAGDQKGAPGPPDPNISPDPAGPAVS